MHKIIELLKDLKINFIFTLPVTFADTLKLQRS